MSEPGNGLIDAVRMVGLGLLPYVLPGEQRKSA